MSDVRTIELRPVEAGDTEFLRRLYGTTREAEMALVAWTDDQKAAFVDMQYQAQDRHYRTAYPEAAFNVITVDGCPAGRLYVDRSDQLILLIDLCLLPDHQGQGIGTNLLRALQAEAAETGRPVRLHVEVGNPAALLYERLGFDVVAEQGLYRELEWRGIR